MLIARVSVLVCLLRALKIKHCWSEAGQRERRWFPIELASDKVIEPELAALIREFAGA